MFSTVSPSECKDLLQDDFRKKVRYNFKLHVLLCLKNALWNRDVILQQICSLDGYRCHKVVRYGTNWSHLHVKFSEARHANQAVDFFTNLNSDLTAILVDDMLRVWYHFEMKFASELPWTVAVVDVVGITPGSLNFLTPNLVDYILKDFGQPYLLPYTAAVNEPHVQVLFSSMTEALAACMAYGQWYNAKQITDQFCYRVRINPSHKEAFLIQNCGGTPEEAFGLDYFVTASYEISQSLNRAEDIQQNGALPICKMIETRSKDQRGGRLIKEKPQSRRNWTHVTQNKSPVVFVPLVPRVEPSVNQKIVAVEEVFPTVQVSGTDIHSTNSLVYRNEASRSEIRIIDKIDSTAVLGVLSSSQKTATQKSGIGSRLKNKNVHKNSQTRPA